MEAVLMAIARNIFALIKRDNTEPVSKESANQLLQNVNFKRLN